MSNIDETEDNKMQPLIQSLNQHLVTLATSLKGQLSPGEEETLATLFQLQLNMQALLAHSPVPTSQPEIDSEPDLAKEQPDDYTEQATKIAHAQAMQYARDLVEAIREKKEQQRRLELTSQQLIRAEKLATVGQIAAAVAHEMGNILTPLLMYAKLIYKETVDIGEPELAGFAAQITHITNRASNMLRQLVDAARNERAMMIPVEVDNVIDKSMALLLPQLNKHGIKIEHQYSDNLPLVLGRPDQLEQVFINLGLNACDAMPEGGNFIITLDPANGTQTQVNHSEFITIRLSDTGVGIPPENISRLFEPFYTTKERGAGSGLGLFVSHLIVDQHGGVIEVESKPNVGTTFIIKLPARDNRGKN